MFRESTVAIAVVTSQPDQEYKPLTPVLLRVMAIPKDRVFDNSAERIFYQEKTSRGPEDTNAFSSSVPGNKGTCSARIAVLPSIPEDVAKKIALSLAAVGAKT